MQDQEVYRQKYESLVAKADAAKARLEATKREKCERIARREKVKRFLGLIRIHPEPLVAFDEKLWQVAVESMVVRTKSDVTVVFRSGTKIAVGLVE